MYSTHWASAMKLSDARCGFQHARWVILREDKRPSEVSLLRTHICLAERVCGSWEKWQSADGCMTTLCPDNPLTPHASNECDSEPLLTVALAEEENRPPPLCLGCVALRMYWYVPCFPAVCKRLQWQATYPAKEDHWENGHVWNRRETFWDN